VESAADAAANPTSRSASGLVAPAAHEATWRKQRREARRALTRASMPVRIVTTPGRIKSS
jgi:hypothetical protein